MYAIRSYYDLKALSTPVKAKQNNFKYMAISNKENELLIRFWEENEDLILKAVEATRDNSHIEPERREVASKISELLNNKVEKVGAYVKRNLIQLFEQNKISSEELIDFQDAEYSKRTFDIQYPLLKKVINTNRITSYNVCYTKLLRSYLIHLYLSFIKIVSP